MPNKKTRYSFGFEPYLSANTNICILCGSGNAELNRRKKYPEEWYGWCNCCSNIFIEAEALEYLRRENKCYLISSYFRQKAEGTTLTCITMQNVSTIIEQIPQFSILEKLDIVLIAIAEQTKTLGAYSTFRPEEDWPLLSIEGKDACVFIINELADMDRIRTERTMTSFNVQVKYLGYLRLQEVQSSGINSQMAFIAMPFKNDEDRTDIIKPEHIWSEIIKPAVLNAGYEPYRVDKEEHNEKIDDKIIAQIRKCRFLVADFTLQRNGVYFEAGFAMGLGRNVIWMCHKSDKENLHFDTRQYNHILYDEITSAREDLTNRIEAIEGHGKFKSS